MTTVLESGQLTSRLGLPDLNPAHDRIMIYGNPGSNKDRRFILDANYFDGVYVTGDIEASDVKRINAERSVNTENAEDVSRLALHNA